jgi:hypothetical protein
MQLFVARPGRAQGELLDPVSSEARVRVAIDEARDSAQPAAVKLGDLTAEPAQVAHPAGCRDPAVLAENERILDDIHLAERLPAQGHLVARGGRELREVANEEACGRHTPEDRGIGGSRPPRSAASSASS